MAYHTNVYLFLFLPCVLLLYSIVPQRKRWYVLLGASYLFFYFISGKLVLYLIGTTIFTHYISIRIANVKAQYQAEIMQISKEQKTQTKEKNKKVQKNILLFGIITLLSILVYFKYSLFFFHNLAKLLPFSDSNMFIQPQQLIVPIGISFYTLQAIGYMVDVYWGKVAPEPNLGKLALFLGFFPQVMQGPICQYSDTAESVWKCDSLKKKNLSMGTLRILWGLFKKLIIADRLNTLVASIFNQYESYNGVLIIIAAIAYTIQLYMEFSGCMDIVIGSGNLFGIHLPENFRQPFVSRNAAEFWRRWHITLGSWFKTYIFYPISVSKVMKKWNKFGKQKFGKYITNIGSSASALFPIWLCNGLWHGPRWSYIFYGMYYFTIIMLGTIFKPIRDQWIHFFKINEDATWFKITQILKTWVIIITGELFFRANGLRAGVTMFLSIFREFSLEPIWNGSLLSLGLDKADFIIIITSCFVVAVVDLLKEYKNMNILTWERNKYTIQWCAYYALIFSIIIFGAYGVGYQKVELIYAGF